MKAFKYYLTITALVFLFTSCKKDSPKTENLSSLNIVLATLNVPSTYTYFTNSPSNFYLQQTPLFSMSGIEFAIPVGNYPISIVSTADTANSLFKGSFVIDGKQIYTLYLAGSASKIDTLFLKEYYPPIIDSSAGVRFINLAQDGLALSINLEGQYPNQLEYDNLQYKQVTEFKNYPANSLSSSSYNFEVRNKSTGTLLTTFSWPYTIRRNTTLIITGVEDITSTNPTTVFQVNNY